MDFFVKLKSRGKTKGLSRTLGNPCLAVQSYFSGTSSPSTLLNLDPPPSSKRRALMARIRSRDTQPEMLVRRLLHRYGYRYRLHAKDLPGRPDMVFRSRKKAIFVHGCFWHQHEGCKRATIPKTRVAYWEPKLKANKKRDAASISALKKMGWKAIVVWECEISTRNQADLFDRLKSFLDEKIVD